MTSRRSRRSERAGCSAGSLPPWGCDDGAGPGPRYQQANASSRASRWGRHRHRRPPSAGKGPCERHPRARGAGTSPSRERGRTVRRRRWISLGSGRSATPHPGRTQPYLDPTRSGETTRPTPFGGTWGWPPAKANRTTPTSPARRGSRPPIPPPPVRGGSRSIRTPTERRGPPATGTRQLPAQISSTPGWCTSTPSRGSTRRRARAQRRVRPASGRAGTTGRGSPPTAAPGRGPAGGTPWPQDRSRPVTAKVALATPPRPCGEVWGGQIATLSNRAPGRAGSLRVVRSPCPAKPIPNKAGTRRRRTRQWAPAPHPSPTWRVPQPMRRHPGRHVDPANRPTTRTRSGVNRSVQAGPLWRAGRRMIPRVTSHRRSGPCRTPDGVPCPGPEPVPGLDGSPGGVLRQGSGPGPPPCRTPGEAMRRHGQSRRCRCRGRRRWKLRPGKEPRPQGTSRTSHRRRTLAGHVSSRSASGQEVPAWSEEATIRPIGLWATARLRRPGWSRPATRAARRRHRGTPASRTSAARTPAAPRRRERCRRCRPVRRRSRLPASTTARGGVAPGTTDVAPARRPRDPPPVGRRWKSRPQGSWGLRRPSRWPAVRRPARVAPRLRHTRTWRLLTCRTLPFRQKRREVVEW
jgi:hypothetical protein